MSALDDELERLRTAWSAVARYRVYRSSWCPTKAKVIIESGLSYGAAMQRAADEYGRLKRTDPKMQGRFGDDFIGFELENKAELDAGRRSRALNDCGSDEKSGSQALHASPGFDSSNVDFDAEHTDCGRDK
jgi:hypothetical protein